MTLPAGTRLGNYEIVGLLGEGGMGEVYRAVDTKLDREVAIKVLPTAFAQHQERLARFEREAKVLASLKHNNIAAIYAVEESSDGKALVMELVEGATLKGPVPLDTALKYATQIASALEAAHEKGITHRDLKPANVMLTPDGTVKVLDFGLAAVTQPAQNEGEVGAHIVTLTMSPTQAGMIMGTAAYMSPEQARGQTVDRRADIWAFGVVLWEVLTGKQLFQGDTVSDILASVLTKEPDFKQVPSKVQRLLRRCLEKDPKKRLRDIGGALELLDGDAESAAVRPSKAARWFLAVAALAGVFALALIVAGVLLYNATRPAPLRPLMSLNIDLDDNTRLATGSRGGLLALSPDGTRLALALRDGDGKVRLHTRLLNQSQVTPLAGTEDASNPFFSPDGEWVGFFTNAELKKISVEGGPAVKLCDVPSNSRGASWGDDGNIIAALGPYRGLTRIPSAGGPPVAVTKLNPGEMTHRWPQVLPGSQTILFTAATNIIDYDDANIDVISLKTGQRKTVQRGGLSPRYLAASSRVGSSGTGHLIYLHQSTLFAVPFDPGRLVLTGVPTPILEDVSNSTTQGGDFAYAQNGTFVYLAGNGKLGGWSISWVDSSGKTEPLQATRRTYFMPRLSPDGKRLAFSMSSVSGLDLWVKDLDRDTPSRLSFLPGQNGLPVWTPDGKNIVFQSSNASAPGLYWIRSDGSGEAQRLTDGKLQEAPNSFSPDGKRLAFSQSGNGGSQDIFTAPIEGDSGHRQVGKPELFLGTPFNESSPEFSPDGRWMAYVSLESGIPEVYVRPFPGPGGRWQISTGGGNFPRWSRDGRELLFETTMDQRVMAVGYSASGDSFTPGKPRVWSEIRLMNTGNVFNYDLAPDGKRLAALLADDDASGGQPRAHLTVLVNFFDELRRKVPVGK